MEFLEWVRAETTPAEGVHARELLLRDARARGDNDQLMRVGLELADVDEHRVRMSVRPDVRQARLIADRRLAAL